MYVQYKYGISSFVSICRFRLSKEAFFIVLGYLRHQLLVTKEKHKRKVLKFVDCIKNKIFHIFRVFIAIQPMKTCTSLLFDLVNVIIH